MTEEQLKALADAMLNGDHIDVFTALEPVLSFKDFKDLAAMCELCYVHHCDDQICRDDRLRCQP